MNISYAKYFDAVLSTHIFLEYSKRGKNALRGMLMFEYFIYFRNYFKK